MSDRIEGILFSAMFLVLGSIIWVMFVMMAIADMPWTLFLLLIPAVLSVWAYKVLFRKLIGCIKYDDLLWDHPRYNKKALIARYGEDDFKKYFSR